MKIMILAYLLSAGMITSAFSQKSPLEGSWKMDSVSIVRSSDKAAIEMQKVKQNPYFVIFEKMTFQENMLTLVDNGYDVEGHVDITSNKIAFNFIPVNIEAQYLIKDEQLFIERHISYRGDEQVKNDNYIILIKYTKQ
jgi:hypothetical protein